MAFFDNEAEKQRKAGLEQLETKRVAFAEKLKAQNVRPTKSLYAQAGGGFHCIASDGEAYYYITGPAPGEEADFNVKKVDSLSIRTEDIFIKSEGIGGFMGFGKKGGIGFRMLFSFPDGETGDIELVSGQNCFLEILDKPDAFYDTKRRRGNANYVWNFAPVQQDQVRDLLPRWLTILGDVL